MVECNIFKALDSLGYSKDIVGKRSWIGKKVSEGSTIYHRRKYGENVDIVLTGSRREGIATSHDNDVDQMFVDTVVLCTESKCEVFDNYTDYYAIFAIDTHRAQEGYTFLELVRINANDAEIPINLKKALTDYKGSKLLKNDKVTLKAVSPLLRSVQIQHEEEGWMKKTIQLNEEKNGPSVSYRLSVPYINVTMKFDDCLAFQCNAPSLLKTWCGRERKYEWPSNALIKQIEGMTGHVVPVGMKGHPDQLFQWRICFTLAEIALVQTFNDTQIKVYAVMKNLSKHVFKTVCLGITSYVMKNVLFWISEVVPKDKFEPNNFPERIQHALDYLKGCISMGRLPSYMIAKRNLLEGKMSKQEQDKLIQLIECLMFEGPRAALRIPEVFEVIDANEETKKNKFWINDFREQAYLAPFALPSNDMAEFLMKVMKKTTTEEVLDLYMGTVIPYIREYNPQGFFDIFANDDECICNLARNFPNLSKHFVMKMLIRY